MAVVLVFLTFGGLDYWVLMSKHQYAEHLAERYLQRMAIEGRLSSADEADLIADFASIGSPVESITGPRESRGNPRVLRNPESAEASKVVLRIVSKPEPEPLFLGKIIGGQTAGDDYRIIVGGERISERVHP